MGKYKYSIGAVKKFFKGIQNEIDRLSNKNKDKYEGLSIDEIKLIYYIQYAETIFNSYKENKQDIIEMYNSDYDILENCLKTNPDKFKEYIEKYPIIIHFLAAYLGCNEDKNADQFITVFK